MANTAGCVLQGEDVFPRAHWSLCYSSFGAVSANRTECEKDVLDGVYRARGCTSCFRSMRQIFSSAHGDCAALGLPPVRVCMNIPSSECSLLRTVVCFQHFNPQASGTVHRNVLWSILRFALDYNCWVVHDHLGYFWSSYPARWVLCNMEREYGLVVKGIGVIAEWGHSATCQLCIIWWL